MFSEDHFSIHDVTDDEIIEFTPVKHHTSFCGFI